ncbi:hypothetical protein EDC01DRAFT_530637 [Geopyxis carbonaria]|nr:hypothetical protein EDC01DRAFT_530637 [Geopyxis carbonaria]
MTPPTPTATPLSPPLPPLPPTEHPSRWHEKQAEGLANEQPPSSPGRPPPAVLADKPVAVAEEVPVLEDALCEKPENKYRLDYTGVECYLEKGMPAPEPSDSSDLRRVSRVRHPYLHSGVDEDDDGDDRSVDYPRHKSSFVWRTLGFLTFVNPLLCLFNALYTLAILAVVAVSFPFKYLASSSSVTSFPQCVNSLVAPLLCIHLRFLHPSPPPKIPLESFGALRLVIVHLLSPLISIPLAIASGCVAFVWMYTEVILGETNDRKGMEYRSFLFVKHFWEEYALSSLKPKSLDGAVM